MMIDQMRVHHPVKKPRLAVTNRLAVGVLKIEKKFIRALVRKFVRCRSKWQKWGVVCKCRRKF